MGCCVLNAADVFDVADSTDGDAALGADCVVTTVLCPGVCSDETMDGACDIDDSNVGGLDCGGVGVDTVCVVNVWSQWSRWC